MRLFVRAALVAVSTIAGHAQDAAAQTYPNRPVRMIIPFGTGGTLTVLGNVLGQKLGEKWGQQIVLDPRPGAGGTIGTEMAARSPADGYTLLFTTQSLAVNATLTPSPHFDPIKSFEPIVHLASGENILLVPAGSPFKELKDLVAYAKANPGKLDAASVGVGSTSYLATELFKSIAGVEIVVVPYNGAAPASTDLIAGRIGCWITTLGSAVPVIKNGNARALAISGNRRSPDLPDVPTFAEAGYKDFRASAWFALFAPAGTPPDIIRQVNADVNAALAMPDLRQRFATVSVDATGGTAAELQQLLADEIATWADVLKKTGLAKGKP